MNEELKKSYPQGWALKAEFIDPEGRIYHKGKLVEDPTEKITQDDITPKNKPVKEESETSQLLKELQKLRDELNEVKAHQNTPQFTNAQFIQEKKPFGVYDVVKKPDDDFMGTPKTYIMVGKGFSLPGYIKEGQEILAPFNQPLYFRNEFSETQFVGDNVKVIPFSQYTTYSKLESKFIEESPYFGITIHQNKQDAMSVDLTTVDKIENAILNIQKMDKNGLLARAVSLGLDIRQEETKLRAAITKIAVAQETARDTQQMISNRLLNREMDNEKFKNIAEE